jgi:hypothetical protein
VDSKITIEGLQIQITSLEANLLGAVNVIKDLKTRIDEIDSEVDYMINTMFGSGPSEKDQ